MTPNEMLKEINDILDVPEKKSHVDKIIPLLHGKWELQIMLEICRANILRFGECKKRIPNITNSVLTAALRNLEKWGLITRTQYNEIPLRVEYTPTEKGKSLLPVCYEIIKWGAEHSLDDSSK
ncbi:MAG: helix-turn-helix transcriptional regulator [Clostridia bacterium]|nr:helix-turn-helix transcriptional regulator [Clostridia bacterium]